MTPWNERLEEALEQADPLKAARQLALECRDAGISQQELMALFDQARKRHATEPESAAYNAVVDVMDDISGWCAPHNRLYPDQLT